MKRTKQSVRLPTHVIPNRYNITIKPDLESFTFAGEEVIFVTLKKAAKEIILHAKEIEILTAEAIYKKSDAWTAKIKYNERLETATLFFKNKIPSGKVQLKLSFRGILNNQMRGFYRSKYVHDGNEKFLATTQLEPTDARRAFPCFDEPSHKAVFEVTMVVPNSHEAISNTIPSAIADETGFKAVRFAPTPKMSTYLVAFIAGEFEKMEGYTKRKGKKAVLVRVFATPGKIRQAKFALDCAIKTLEFFEDYFAIPYPLPALDLIAIPDFTSAAMENWGAVTYRELALLVDEEHSSTAMRQRVAIVIAHELAHQWFGNLVTMEWWTHLWLNEGFAAFIEYMAVDKIFPHWHIWDQYLYLDSAAALAADSLTNTHAIEIPVHHPDEINEIFDAISYQKGSSIIRMLQAYVGDAVFRDGLRHYLKKHAYKNTQTNDLWISLEKVSGKPVRKIMNAWTSLPGHPLITVAQNDGTIMLSQSRFYASRLERLRNKNKQLWPVPLNYQLLGKKHRIKNILFDKKITTIAESSKGVLNLNPGETGFYRVDYPIDHVETLKSAIEAKDLKTTDRFGLLRDQIALAESGQSPTTLALSLLQSYREETEYVVWLQIVSGLRKIWRLVQGTSSERLFNQYARHILSKISAQLGWTSVPGERHTDQLLRGVILHSYAGYGDAKTIKKASELFNNHIRNKRIIAPDFRQAVYQIVAESGSKKDFTMMVKQYISDIDSEEKVRLARSLPHFADAKLIKKSLEIALSKHTRPQDTMFFLLSAWLNPYGASVTWKFLKRNWQAMLDRYGHGGHLLVRMIENAEVMQTKTFLADFDRFFKTHPAPGAERTIKQIKEQIMSNIDWKAREQKDIGRWLKDWSKKHQK